MTSKPAASEYRSHIWMRPLRAALRFGLAFLRKSSFELTEQDVRLVKNCRRLRKCRFRIVSRYGHIAHGIQGNRAVIVHFFLPSYLFGSTNMPAMRLRDAALFEPQFAFGNPRASIIFPNHCSTFSLFCQSTVESFLPLSSCSTTDPFL